MSKATKPALIYLSLCIYTVAPVLTTGLAILLAKIGDTTLNEASTHPCIILGHDFGGFVYGLFLTSWLATFTVPSGVLSLICYTVILIRQKYSRKQIIEDEKLPLSRIKY